MTERDPMNGRPRKAAPARRARARDASSSESSATRSESSALLELDEANIAVEQQQRQSETKAERVPSEKVGPTKQRRRRRTSSKQLHHSDSAASPSARSRPKASQNPSSNSNANSKPKARANANTRGATMSEAASNFSPSADDELGRDCGAPTPQTTKRHKAARGAHDHHVNQARDYFKPGPRAAASQCARLALGATVFVGLIVVLLLSEGQADAIKLQPEGREKIHWSGEQLVITCQNNNNVKNVKFQWIGPDGLAITEDRLQRVHAETSGPHRHRLVVMNATAGHDDGPYKCTIGSADDRSPREHIEFTLKLYHSTGFRDTPRHLVLPAGRPGAIQCRADFDARVQAASVSWLRDGRPIEYYNDSSVLVQDYEPGRQLSELVVSPMTRQHEGVYTCRALAVTSELSKISDFDIRLEAQFAPSFDRDSQTIWVERPKHLVPGSPPGRATGELGARPAGSAFGAHPPGARLRLNPKHQHQHQQQLLAGGLELGASNGSAGQLGVVQVELQCGCEANPPVASIHWTSSSTHFVLGKGEPAHVLENPRERSEGRHFSSSLLIGYQLDPDWPYRRDTYTCSAKNKLGSATKTFVIEQGDPPPPLTLGTFRHYDANSSLFLLTVLGPPDAGSPDSPQIDALRVRAEPPGARLLGALHDTQLVAHHQPATTTTGAAKSAGGRARPLDEAAHSVQVPVSLAPGAQNITINLGRLPSGKQRLLLDAHNPVGWSAWSHDLGEYQLERSAGGAPSAAFAQRLLVPLALLGASTLALVLYERPRWLVGAAGKQ